MINEINGREKEEEEEEKPCFTILIIIKYDVAAAG